MFAILNKQAQIFIKKKFKLNKNNKNISINIIINMIQYKSIKRLQKNIIKLRRKYIWKTKFGI